MPFKESDNSQSRQEMENIGDYEREKIELYNQRRKTFVRANGKLLKNGGFLR